MRADNNVSSLRPITILHVVGSLNRGGIETWPCHAVARYRDGNDDFNFGDDVWKSRQIHKASNAFPRRRKHE